MRYTQMDESKVTEADCLIIDAIGFLSGIYRYGQVAYIGGGFGVGIHNTLEAAVYGIPVVFGPNHTAFREALGLLDAGGGFTIVNADEYNTVLNRFLTDQSFLSDSGKKAGNYVSENSGATEVIFSAVFKNK
jgi:3-deoxy-D-manno-octulosonic-acid transferase